jgi:hypothetical protein
MFSSSLIVYCLILTGNLLNVVGVLAFVLEITPEHFARRPAFTARVDHNRSTLLFEQMHQFAKESTCIDREAGWM